MYMLIKSLSLQQLLTKQIPAMGSAFIIAELFYKFHSFALECLAFLVTWFVLDAAINFLVKVFGNDTGQLQKDA